MFGQSEQPHRFQQSQCAYAVSVGSIFGRVEAHLHVAHCREVVYLVRLHLLHYAGDVHRISHIAVVQDEIAMLQVRILVDMVYPLGIEHRCTALDAMNDVSLLQKILAQVGSVLSGHAGYKSSFRHRQVFSKVENFTRMGCNHLTNNGYAAGRINF